jgi:hypothetical protein
VNDYFALFSGLFSFPAVSQHLINVEWCIIVEPQVVEHGGDTDVSAEMFGVGGDCENGSMP